MSITLKLTEDISLKFIKDDYFNTEFGGIKNQDRNLYIKKINNFVESEGKRRLQTVSSLISEWADIWKWFLENIDLKKWYIVLWDHDDENYEADFGENTYEILK